MQCNLETGLFDEARKVLSDAIIDLEKTHTASSDFCKVRCPIDEQEQ